MVPSLWVVAPAPLNFYCAFRVARSQRFVELWPGKRLWLFLLRGMGLAAHQGGERDGEGAKPGDGWKRPETQLFLCPAVLPCSHRHSQEQLRLLLGDFPHTAVWL